MLMYIKDRMILCILWVLLKIGFDINQIFYERDEALKLIKTSNGVLKRQNEHIQKLQVNIKELNHKIDINNKMYTKKYNELLSNFTDVSSDLIKSNKYIDELIRKKKNDS